MKYIYSCSCLTSAHELICIFGIYEIWRACLFLAHFAVLHLGYIMVDLCKNAGSICLFRKMLCKS